MRTFEGDSGLGIGTNARGGLDGDPARPQNLGDGGTNDGCYPIKDD